MRMMGTTRRWKLVAESAAKQWEMPWPHELSTTFGRRTPIGLEHRARCEAGPHCVILPLNYDRCSSCGCIPPIEHQAPIYGGGRGPPGWDGLPGTALVSDTSGPGETRREAADANTRASRPPSLAPSIDQREEAYDQVHRRILLQDRRGVKTAEGPEAPAAEERIAASSDRQSRRSSGFWRWAGDKPRGRFL